MMEPTQPAIQEDCKEEEDQTIEEDIAGINQELAEMENNNQEAEPKSTNLTT